MSQVTDYYTEDSTYRALLELFQKPKSDETVKELKDIVTILTFAEETNSKFQQDFLNKILAECAHVAFVRKLGPYPRHDWSKDLYYMAATVCHFNYGIHPKGLSQLIEDHFYLEDHHPEHYTSKGTQRGMASTSAIREMAFDRLARHRQFSLGPYKRVDTLAEMLKWIPRYRECPVADDKKPKSCIGNICPTPVVNKTYCDIQLMKVFQDYVYKYADGVAVEWDRFDHFYESRKMLRSMLLHDEEKNKKPKKDL